MTDNSTGKTLETITDSKCNYCQKKLSEHTEKDVSCGMIAEITAKLIIMSIPHYKENCVYPAKEFT